MSLTTLDFAERCKFLVVFIQAENNDPRSPFLCKIPQNVFVVNVMFVLSASPAVLTPAVFCIQEQIRTVVKFLLVCGSFKHKHAVVEHSVQGCDAKICSLRFDSLFTWLSLNAASSMQSQD